MGSSKTKQLSALNIICGTAASINRLHVKLYFLFLFQVLLQRFCFILEQICAHMHGHTLQIQTTAWMQLEPQKELNVVLKVCKSSKESRLSPKILVP